MLGLHPARMLSPYHHTSRVWRCYNMLRAMSRIAPASGALIWEIYLYSTNNSHKLSLWKTREPECAGTRHWNRNRKQKLRKREGAISALREAQYRGNRHD